jgi:hypothetical protein
LLDDANDRRKLRLLRGSEARHVVDLLVLVSRQCAAAQQIISKFSDQLLDRFPNGDNADISRALKHLTLHSGEIPQALFLNDVEPQSDTPFGGGGFADVFLGTKGHHTVAIKRLRVFGGTKEDKEKLFKVGQLIMCLLVPWLIEPNIRM